MVRPGSALDRSRARLGLVLLAGLGCRPDPASGGHGEELVAIFGGDRGAACTYVSSLKRPYVVGWDELKLNDLQRAIDGGVPFAVRFEGCSLEPLTHCTVPTGHYYRFAAADMSEPQVIELRSAAEAYSKLQLGGLHLEAHFDTFDQLVVTRALGGTWEQSPATDFFADDFGGSRCEGATHVVQAIDVGAYELRGLKARAGGAGAGGGHAGIQAGAGGSGSTARDELSDRGDPTTCRRGGVGWGSGGTGPAPTCNTPLRLTLQPIRPAEERASMCPYGMKQVLGGRLGELSLISYCLDATEVTVAQYRLCVEDGACRSPSRSRLGTYREASKQQHPVTDVNWFEATRFCEWAGKRLPTAEEWEWAARGREQQRPFPWGPREPTRDLACFDRIDGRLGTCPAGGRPLGRSFDGVLDLAGNVWEWTATPFEGRKGKRAVMGGSWRDTDAGPLRADQRAGRRTRDEGSGDLGFRCAAAVQPLDAGGGAAI